ncbi:MAG: acetyl-CoA synthetase, partial [Oscillospiraceae bacterium]
MKNFYKRFCNEGFDENGVLNKFSINCPDNFNFAYDVVDEIASLQPDRRAMLWLNEDGKQYTFTFKDISQKSNQVANML